MGLFLHLGIMLSVIEVIHHLFIDAIWLVVWNMNFIFPFSWECHHPNCYSLIFFRGVVLPPTSNVIGDFQHMEESGRLNQF